MNFEIPEDGQYFVFRVDREDWENGNDLTLLALNFDELEEYELVDPNDSKVIPVVKKKSINISTP